MKDDENKRRYWIQEMLKENKDLSCEKIVQRLKEEKNIVVTRMTIFNDRKYLETHTVSPIDEDKLQKEYDEYTIKIERTKAIEDKSREEGDRKNELIAIRLASNIQAKREIVSKDMEMIRAMKIAEAKTVWKYWRLGDPKPTDVSKFPDKLSPKDTKDEK